MEPRAKVCMKRHGGPKLMTPITKRSVIIAGQKTSISLELPFWTAVREITQARAITVSDLLEEIDRGRTDANLSSAVRVFVLNYVRQNSALAQLDQADAREDAA